MNAAGRFAFVSRNLAFGAAPASSLAWFSLFWLGEASVDEQLPCRSEGVPLMAPASSAGGAVFRLWKQAGAMVAGALTLSSLAGCLSLTETQPFCADEPAENTAVARAVTWHADVAPIVQGRCARCHADGASAPFPLTTYEEVHAFREVVREAVTEKTMPPFQAASCCNAFRNDDSLTAEQIALIEAWVEQGAPRGNPLAAQPPLPAVGGLSRVDLTVTMAQPYLPQPEPGRIDDFRCFIIDWPLDADMFVTGMNPVPGARALVHHLIVAVVDGEQGQALRAREGHDGRPGFSCEGGLGQAKLEAVIGGSLVGSDLPSGFGTLVEPGSKLLLNVHYSLAGGPAEPDQTRIEFRLDEQARRLLTLPIVNPAWIIGDGMRVAAGNPDAVFRFQYDPFIVTRGRPLQLMGYTPHMHALAARQKFAVVRDDGDVECMTELPRWEFGWEQTYWFRDPVPFREGDDLFIQCHFDNSAANQPIIGGKRLPPRDIAWGTDNQEMCAGFVAFAFEDGKGW